MRIVAWNIRAGGGYRGAALAAHLSRLGPDVAALSEFRATPPSAALAAVLRDLGLVHQLTTADARAPSVNRLLVASRWPLEPVRHRGAPLPPGRWLLARVAAPSPFAIGAMHVPNRVSGIKWPFIDAVTRVAERWREGPALLVGDTNSGRPGIDEEWPAFNAREGAFLDGLERAGWRDAFRHLRGQARAYTWYSPNGRHGFRIDQAFLNPGLLASLAAARHDWGRPRPSDHAALVLDLDWGGSATATRGGRVQLGGPGVAHPAAVAAADGLAGLLGVERRGGQPAARGDEPRDQRDGDSDPRQRAHGLPLSIASVNSLARAGSSGRSRSTVRRASSSRPSAT